MAEPSKTVSLLLPVALDKELTYSVPERITLGFGDIVEVGLGKQGKQLGVVWSESGDSKVPADKLKPIRNRREVLPISKNLRQFIDWVADYTLAARGNVLKMTLCSEDALENPKPKRVFSVADVHGGKMTELRQQVIDFLQSAQAPQTLAQMKEALGINYSVLEKMVAKNMLAESFVQPDDGAVPALSLSPASRTLSDKQLAAAQVLAQKLEQKEFSATLLDGVTGSGKTEVYFYAIRKVLEQKEGQALVLLPEIALTAQLLSRVKREFGIEPVVWHSGISPKKRAEYWRSVQTGAARLVIGARSALFLPYKSLQFMVVDEEHDASYKQEEGVLYHARDMAVVRASIEKIPIVLASATPSLETVVNVEQGKYHELTLPSRFGEAVMPSVEIVDMRSHRVNASSWISEPLKTAMAETLAKGNQVLLFLNRRGYAPLTLCRACGHRMQCPNCSAWLVEHRMPPKMLCHHCGFQRGIPSACPECHQAEHMAACGPGVERLREEAQSLFPQCKVVMLSSESTAAAGALESLVQSIESGEADIIIGTQMVAKGHHFPLLTLVGVVDADLGLAGGDLRAAERTYQLLHQVAGRAGREKEPGRVFIQSYMPENAVIKAMAGHSRDAFMQEERSSREMLSSPPFGRMAAIILSGKKEAVVKKAGHVLMQQMPRQEGLVALGPVPAPMALVRQQFRYRILLKATKQFPLQKAIRYVLRHAKISPSERLKIDIDPYSFM